MFFLEFYFGMNANGLPLQEGGDFEAIHWQPSTNFDRGTKLQVCISPRLTQNPR
jgi:hypothetical protein